MIWGPRIKNKLSKFYIDFISSSTASDEVWFRYSKRRFPIFEKEGEHTLIPRRTALVSPEERLRFNSSHPFPWSPSELKFALFCTSTRLSLYSASANFFRSFIDGGGWRWMKCWVSLRRLECFRDCVYTIGVWKFYQNSSRGTRWAFSQSACHRGIHFASIRHSHHNRKEALNYTNAILPFSVLAYVGVSLKGEDRVVFHGMSLKFH